jgi:hypothetical protein
MSNWKLRVGCIVAFAAAIPSMCQEMKVKVDHASYCGPDLANMRERLSAIGLPTAYGGPHTEVTHMALLGFRDGSYLELIAPQDPHSQMPPGQRWRVAMAKDAGPCAWAIGVSDVGAEVKRLSNKGIASVGPIAGGRQKPDGTKLAWESGREGLEDPGSTLPFFIHDLTDRNLRVQVAPDFATGEITGIDVVVIGVKDIDRAINEFRAAYGFAAPKLFKDQGFGARLAYFYGTPVMLATPLLQGGWLDRRLQTFGDKPAAILLGSIDFRKSKSSRKLRREMRLAGRRVAWFNPDSLSGMRLGVIEVGTIREPR